MTIEIRQKDPIEFEGDALMIPALSSGLMGLPFAARVKAIVGEKLEQEVAKHAPIAVGACLVTEAGSLPAKHLIHSPVLEEMNLRIGVENIRRSVRASLLGATRYKFDTVGIPAFGYEDTGVSHEETARAILDEINGYKGSHPLNVVLLDTNADMIEAFHELVPNR
ncbi:MAG: macro domain-containing protein [Deltaproteobacteria bacterium]|nr:macro domain-containing protein [Deltaproteobacteria bacterium]